MLFYIWLCFPVICFIILVILMKEMMGWCIRGLIILFFVNNLFLILLLKYILCVLVYSSLLIIICSVLVFLSIVLPLLFPLHPHLLTHLILITNSGLRFLFVKFRIIKTWLVFVVNAFQTDAMDCCLVDCSTHKEFLEEYANHFIHTLSFCASKCLPIRSSSTRVRAGWNDGRKVSKGKADFCFKVWEEAGCPSGTLFDIKKKTKKQYKQSVCCIKW